MKCTAELRRKSNDHRSLEVTIMTSNFINAIHASRPPNAFNMFCIMIISAEITIAETIIKHGGHHRLCPATLHSV